MKFSSLTYKMNLIFSSMMGISSNAQNKLGAIGSNSAQKSPNSIWDTIWIILVRTIADFGITVWETLMKVVYAIVKWILVIIDFIFIFIRQIIGLNADFQSVEELTEADLIFQFVFSDSVISVIKGMIGFAIVLIILFSIFAIVKSEYDYAVNGGNNSKGKILASGLRALFLMVLVPVIAIGGMILSNAILKSLYIATAGGVDSSLSSTIFVTAGYDSNAYRRYANNNYKIPITFNFEEVTKNDNIKGWGTDGEIAELDEALTAFNSSDVWNRGFTTFLMFYTDTFFQMDTVDRLNDAYRNTNDDAISSYHAIYDTGIFTRSAEYYVMADVIDYSIKSNRSLYIKTAEEIYNSNSGGYNPISKQDDNYVFEVHYKNDMYPTRYVHKAGATDEADGAVFLIAVGEEVELSSGEYVTRYTPLLSGEDNFKTEYHNRTSQPIVAKGMFEKGENPTAIKEEDGVIKFYRDDLNVPTLVNLFPTISYEMPEGAFENPAISMIKAGVSSVVGVDITQFIPYIYYSIDIFNLFTKTSKIIGSVDNGFLKINYSFSQSGYTMSNLFKMSEFNMVIVTFTSIILVGMLLKILFGLALRVMDVTLLAITYPAVLATLPLDNGSRFKGWVETFIKKILGIYGVVIGVNLVMLLFDPISELNLITPSMIEMAIATHVLPLGLTAPFLNSLVSLLFTLVAFTMIESTIKMITELVNNEEQKDGVGLIKDGEQVVNDLKKVPTTVGKIISGQIILDMGTKAIDAAASLVPGGAMISAGVDKIKEIRDVRAAKKDIKDMKKQMKKGDSSGFEESNNQNNQQNNQNNQNNQQNNQNNQNNQQNNQNNQNNQQNNQNNQNNGNQNQNAQGGPMGGQAQTGQGGPMGGQAQTGQGGSADGQAQTGQGGPMGDQAQNAPGAPGSTQAGVQNTEAANQANENAVNTLSNAGVQNGQGEAETTSTENADNNAESNADSSAQTEPLDDKASETDSMESEGNGLGSSSSEAQEAAEAPQGIGEENSGVGDADGDVDDATEGVSGVDKAKYVAKYAKASVSNEVNNIKETLLKGDIKGYFADTGEFKDPDQEIAEYEQRKARKKKGLDTNGEGEETENRKTGGDNDVEDDADPSVGPENARGSETANPNVENNKSKPENQKTTQTGGQVQNAPGAPGSTQAGVQNTEAVNQANENAVNTLSNAGVQNGQGEAETTSTENADNNAESNADSGAQTEALDDKTSETDSMESEGNSLENSSSEAQGDAGVVGSKDSNQNVENKNFIPKNHVFKREQLLVSNARESLMASEMDDDGVIHSEKGLVSNWDNGVRQHGANAAINASNLPNSNKTITIQNTKDNNSQLEALRNNINEQRIAKTKIETSAFMFGHHDKGGNIIIDHIISDQNKYNRNKQQGIEAEAQFDGELTQLMNDYLKEKGNEDLVLVHTHTHPSYGNEEFDKTKGNHFSAADLNGYVDLDNQIYKAGFKNVQVMGAVMNSSGDLNFVGVNDKTNAMEKYTDVKMSDGREVENYTKGNYKNPYSKK